MCPKHSCRVLKTKTFRKEVVVGYFSSMIICETQQQHLPWCTSGPNKVERLCEKIGTDGRKFPTGLLDVSRFVISLSLHYPTRVPLLLLLLCSRPNFINDCGRRPWHKHNYSWCIDPQNQHLACVPIVPTPLLHWANIQTRKAKICLTYIEWILPNEIQTAKGFLGRVKMNCFSKRIPHQSCACWGRRGVIIGYWEVTGVWAV